MERSTPGAATFVSPGSRAESERAAAFRVLADTQLDDSYGLAAAILGDPTEAQDAVHDAIVAAWQRWSSLRDPAKFEPWFRRIVVNTCRERLRRSARRKTTDIDAQADLVSPDATPAVLDKLQVERGLSRLKPDDRIVLALRYYRDLRIEDIAIVLGVPPGTATSRVRLAHERLRRVLGHERTGGSSR